MRRSAPTRQPGRIRGPGRPGIGVRLLLAQTLVLVAGAATAWTVAAVVGPPMFRDHLQRAGVAPSSAERFHADQAYHSATALSLAVAVGAAAVAALAVTWYLTRRLQRSVTDLVSAATAVSRGRYDVRVPPTRLGDEFDALTEAFNQMAASLGSIEETRGRLLGDLAHEMRTPVAVLEAYLEAFEDGVATLDPDTVRMLRDQTRRLARFSDDVRALSQAEEAHLTVAPSWVSPGALVTAAVAAASDTAVAAGVTVTARLADPLPQVWGDPHRLGQVLDNLLDNAIRHTPPHGRVDVTADADDNAVAITVADTGDGIPPDQLPHVFERFYRVDAARDRAHGGAGIGLAIAKALAEAHGGHITAASDGPGRGARFTVTLPIGPRRSLPS